MATLEQFLTNLKAEAMKAPAMREPITLAIDIDGTGDTSGVTLIRTCVWCHGRSFLEVSFANNKAYTGGAHVQTVWPDLSTDVREIIMSGTHPVCFAEMFKDSDDDGVT